MIDLFKSSAGPLKSTIKQTEVKSMKNGKRRSHITGPVQIYQEGVQSDLLLSGMMDGPLCQL